MSDAPLKRPEPPDLFERGATRADGQPQRLDTRLFLQLQVFTDVAVPPAALLEAARPSGLELVLYADATDPRAIAIVTVAEDPARFATVQRELFAQAPFSSLIPVPGLTMMGRTYGSGRERDLADWLLRQVRLRLTRADQPWAIWYPLRRKPAFYQLETREQMRILAEHGMLGHAYGEAGLAQDIRLKSFGLDRDDNEFLIGLVGPQLHPLSRLVEDMRQTQQTALWLDSLGPFFIGYRLGHVNLG